MAIEPADRMQEILDRQDIHDVAMRYCRACDRIDAELLRTVFHDDAYLAYGTFNGVVRDFVPWVMNHIRTGYTHGFHSIANEYVVIDGDVAYGELYAILHYSVVNEEGQSVDSTLGGRYVDRYERRQDEWRIAHRQFVLDWMESRPSTEQPAEGASNEDLLSVGKRTPEDASYSVLPSEPARILDW
jgi:hypothetical protein